MSTHDIHRLYNDKAPPSAKAASVKMNYLEGGKLERWTFTRADGDVVIDVPAMTSPLDIVAGALAG